MEQSTFAFALPRVASSLWLMAAEPAVVTDVARLLRYPHIIVDAEDGSKIVAPGECILLARQDTPTCQLFQAVGSASPGPLSDPEALRRALIVAGRVTSLRSSDVLVISSGASAREAGVIGGSSTHLERFLAQLASPGVLQSPEFRSELCRSFGKVAPKECDPDLRSLIRLESIREPARMGRLEGLTDALALLRDRGLQTLLTEALRRDRDAYADQQLALPWAKALPNTAPEPRLGYTVRRMTALGIRLPGCAGSGSRGRVAPVRELAWSAPVPKETLSAALSNVQSRLVRLRVFCPRRLPAAGVEASVVLDWEMRHFLGIDGLCTPGERRFGLEVRARGCIVEPNFAEMRLGVPLRVGLKPEGIGSREIVLSAYDNKGACVRARLAFGANPAIIPENPRPNVV